MLLKYINHIREASVIRHAAPSLSLREQASAYELIQRQAEPIGVFFRVIRDIFAEGLDRYQGEISRLFGIDDRILVIMTDEDMKVFVFGETVREIHLVDEFERFFEFAVEAHFFLKAPESRGKRRFAWTRMAAAGIGPQPAAMVFSERSLLQHQFASGVENEDGKSPMQEAELVSPQFLFLSDRPVMFINENERKRNCGLTSS